MMEENVVSAAGTTHRTTLAQIDRQITDAGYEAKRRRQDYTIIAGGAEGRMGSEAVTTHVA